MVPTTSLIPIHDANPTRRFSWVAVTLIAINVLVFVAQPKQGLAEAESARAAAFFCQLGVVPREITQQPPTRPLLCAAFPPQSGGAYLSLLTSMFVHGSFLHLAGNMLFLWVFGNNIEDTLGKAKFIAFYLATGLAAGLAHVFTNPTSDIPTVGASGAVAGLLGAYIVLFPHARITTIVPTFFVWFVQLPAIVVLGFWFLSQFLIGAAQQIGGGGVAWMAHVGGFIAGALLILALRPPRREQPVIHYPRW